MRFPSFALALSGDVAQSRALADDLQKGFSEDTSVQYIYLPTLQALFSLNAHDTGAALQSLQTSSRLDLAVGGIGFTGFFGGLYPIYLFALWKDADPKIPVINQARAEYAKLQ